MIDAGIVGCTGDGKERSLKVFTPFWRNRKQQIEHVLICTTNAESVHRWAVVTGHIDTPRTLHSNVTTAMIGTRALHEEKEFNFQNNSYNPSTKNNSELEKSSELAKV
jgi:hypothetical protein